MAHDVPIPKLVRALRDGPPEMYFRDDLQVALDAAETGLTAPVSWRGLAAFYDNYIRKPFPPLVMVVEIRENRFGHVEVDLVNRRNRRYYEKLVEESGRGLDANDSLVYLQREDVIEHFIEEFRLTRAQVNEIRHGWTVRVKAARDLFEHFFSYSNEIDLGV